MTRHTPDKQANNADAQPVHPTEQVLHDMQAVNEQLVLAGLREQALAEQLRQQLAFTNAIMTSLGEGVYVLDPAGRCTFVNPAAERILGWTGADLHGKSIDVILPALTALGTASTAVSAAILDVLHSGTTHQDDNALFLHRDGGVFPVAYVAAPIIIDGQASGAVITFRDITEVQRLQRLREEYVSLISHDLRAPLTVILGRTQHLLRQLTRQELLREANSAEIIIESSHRMNDMIQELLDRSHLDARPDSVQRTTVDLVILVQHMIEQTVASKDRARITLDAIETLPVVVDMTQIERVVVNLLTNALKFSASDAAISIRVDCQERHALVAVADAGIGIAPEDLPRLFEKHYRAATAGAIAGNGLGLYSSRLSIEAHGGQIWAESTPGTGSTFTFALPLARACTHTV